MKSILLILMFTIPTLFTNDSKELADLYINNYKDIAIAEMQRTKIPASIKLAQGLLESDWGRSDLAKTANNHFGIKCGGTWDGSTFFKHDDDTDENGELIESCFRAFSNPVESYMAHSDFLTDPKKQYRYGFLFEYDTSDYKAWAYGLKSSGYASDPSYPDKLIKIIENYQLYNFDKVGVSDTFVVSTSNRNNTPTGDTNTITETISKKQAEKTIISEHVTRLEYDIEIINECRMVRALGGETVQQLARKVGLPLEDIILINEQYNNGDVTLHNGEIIYIEKKKRNYDGPEQFHLVKEGETMEQIAQLYGIRVRSLYAKNRMPKNTETIAGAKLQLKETVSLDKRPKFRFLDGNREHTLLFEEDETVK